MILCYTMYCSDLHMDLFTRVYIVILTRVYKVQIFAIADRKTHGLDATTRQAASGYPSLVIQAKGAFINGEALYSHGNHMRPGLQRS